MNIREDNIIFRVNIDVQIITFIYKEREDASGIALDILL